MQYYMFYILYDHIISYNMIKMYHITYHVTQYHKNRNHISTITSIKQVKVRQDKGFLDNGDELCIES